MNENNPKNIFMLNRIQEEDTDVMLQQLAEVRKIEGDGLDGLAMQASLVTLNSIKNLG
jgi:hypothetical protein